jgi:hypothetical protein
MISTTCAVTTTREDAKYIADILRNDEGCGFGPTIRLKIISNTCITSGVILQPTYIGIPREKVHSRL